MKNIYGRRKLKLKSQRSSWSSFSQHPVNIALKKPRCPEEGDRLADLMTNSGMKTIE